MGRITYKERMLRGTGVSSKESYSKIGSQLLSKLGWKKGEGLGKNKEGIKECI